MHGTRGGRGAVSARTIALLVATCFAFGIGSGTALANKEYKASINSKAPSQSLRSSAQTEYLKRIAFTWKADPAYPLTRIEISLADQRIYGFQGDALVVDGPVSTGKEGHSTPRGKFVVQNKDADHFSGSYGAVVDRATGRTINGDATPGSYVPPGAVYQRAPMPYFMRLTGYGIGLHAGFLPGYAASHGCIRLPKELAAKLFDSTNVGTPVTIVAGGVAMAKP